MLSAHVTVLKIQSESSERASSVQLSLSDSVNSSYQLYMLEAGGYY